MPVLKGFQEFLTRGNVVDLAVAVVVGAAFNAVVQALVKDLITPLLAAVVGKPNFATLHFTINKSVFLYGDFFNALVSFVINAAAVYYFVVVPMNALARLRKPVVEVAAPAVATCPECLSEIPVGAHRCRFCTATLPAGA